MTTQRLCASSRCENPVAGRRIFCDACSNKGTKSKRAIDPINVGGGLTWPKWAKDAVDRERKKKA